MLVADSTADPPRESYPFAPPPSVSPVVVRARFELHDVNAIDEGAETFEFSGVLVLEWNDPRLAFDPVATGVPEKVFTGNFQFDEISPGWYPQVVLVNESGMSDKNGVLMRVRADGSAKLVETWNAIAETDVDMRRFPLDRHRLEAIFEVLGHDRDEVLLEVDPNANVSLERDVEIPQWTVSSIRNSHRDLASPYSGRSGIASGFVLEIDVSRQPFYSMRLIVFPLIIIVMLSFSVFWLDRSSLGDRLSISFIGILTGVSYLIITNDLLPPISYVTLMHGFLNLSFLIMCATVVINLRVGMLDKQGRFEMGDRLDRRCRWLFPTLYFGGIGAIVAIAYGL